MTYRLTLVRLAAITMHLLFGAVLCGGQAPVSAPSAAPGQSVWEHPAAELAEQVAEAMGPGQARRVIRNQSTIAADEIPAIRKLLDQDLKSHGIQASGAESANTIRVTLSENMRERLWVAEVIEGSETRVTIVRVDAGALAVTATAKSGLVLRKQRVIETRPPLLVATQK